MLYKCGYAGGKPPLGYKSVDGELVVVPKEAEVVRLIYDLRKQGMTKVAIAEELNKRGYKTKQGNIYRHSTVSGILNNEEMYRGHYRYGIGHFTPNHHEAILKEDE